MRKKKGTGGINLPDFRLYYKAIVIKTIWFWHENRNVDQWNKTERPEINPCTAGYIFFDKGGKKYTMEKKSPQQVLLGETSTMHKRMKPEHFLTPYPRINSK